MSRSLADYLNTMAESGALDARALARAREIAGITPDTARWRWFLDRALLTGGALFIASGAIFFVAYNWNELERIGKIALLGALVAGSAGFGIVRGPSTPIGRAAMLGATLATGALLAFIGQTFQTGADPWQLFATWAVLCVPWALAAGSASLWAVLLAIANVAVALYVRNLRGWWWIDSGVTAMGYGLVVLNCLALVAAELWLRTVQHEGARVVARLAAVMAIASATLTFMVFVLDRSGRSFADAIVYVVVLSGAYLIYMNYRRDLLIVAVGAFAVVAGVTTVMGRYAGDLMSSSAGLLFTALVLVGLSALAATWIRSLARRWEAR
ncbi:DUF2157 domain-containing protein [Usitatibacter palustris]|uniref:DUF2157 domain-containing protein n=1 Tax=Usitatibacter palustris TaxID=2732487 RepID=A0A6M4H4T2_9PROT|nr:DUF2157 domain-containing protein [Usitatibacter palustris]QJR14651.1 hypothetical protein DSM104440_01461 [Usitatibacter palustris]